MTLAETVELLRALREAGVRRFKSRDLEIEFSGVAASQASQISPPSQTTPRVPEVTMAENKEATERLKDLIRTLKMSDSDLINAMFPVGPEG